MSSTAPTSSGRRIRRWRGLSRVLPVLVALATGLLVAWTGSQPQRTLAERLTPVVTDHEATAQALQQLFERRWQQAGVRPVARADDLTLLRRLSLALHGTIPSLEEIRAFEADTAPDRLGRWTTQFLQDRRFADYFSDRLSRYLIGADEGQFIVFRRDRFKRWLSDQLHAGVPFDVLTRDLITAKGLWTGDPASNFITAAFADDFLDRNKLAGRTARAFLAQRIDCAQCHDHPWRDDWKQSHFEGLAACYGQTQISLVGVEDNPERTYEVENRMTLAKERVDAAVPFGPEWWPSAGTPRERLAAWVTHPQNRRFERAVANRMWGLMFGKPWIDPVDDVPDPAGDGPQPDDLLDVLGADFREHGYNLRRLLAMIAASPPFLLASNDASSDAPESAPEDQSTVGAVLAASSRRDLVVSEDHWAVFPLVRLRPEQVIGAMLQSSSVRTIDQQSHLVTRTIRFFRELDFVRAYGDLGSDELGEQTGTIPQALLRMNGRLTREILEPSPFATTGRLAMLAPDDRSCVETCYLLCLSRRPTGEELAFFQPLLEQAKNDDRARAVEDMAWILFNSPEFSWNH